jgi:hypothetical protein
LILIKSTGEIRWAFLIKFTNSILKISKKERRELGSPPLKKGSRIARSGTKPLDVPATLPKQAGGISERVHGLCQIAAVGKINQLPLCSWNDLSEMVSHCWTGSTGEATMPRIFV